MGESPIEAGAHNLARLVRLSRAPLARPEGIAPVAIVRVPLRGSAVPGAIVGGLLGMLGFALLALVPGTAAISDDFRYVLLTLFAVVGAGLGGLLSRGAAGVLAFDASGVWEERAGARSEGLAWAGLRLREGRTPRLVAPDGRSLAYRGEWAAGSGPDALYLDALVRELPRDAPQSRVPVFAYPLLFSAGLASTLASLPRVVTPVGNDPVATPFSGAWFGWFALSVAGIAAMFMTFVFGLVRLGLDAERIRPEPEREGEGEDGIGALFRGTRYRPAPMEIAPGTVYRYRGEAFWRERDRRARSGRWGMALFGLVLFGLTISVPYLPSPQPTKTDPLFAPIVGGLVLVEFGAFVLLMRPPGRGGLRLRVEGDRALVSRDGEPERAYPWPPARTREATALLDWTDELRSGRRRVRVDRRLLTPVGYGDETGPTPPPSSEGEEQGEGSDRLAATT